MQSHSWDIAGIAQSRRDSSRDWSAVVDRHKPFRRHTQGREEGDALCVKEQSDVWDRWQVGESL